MTKEKDNLCQVIYSLVLRLMLPPHFGTGMVQETISYYVNNESNVYGLLLDATKAFDHN